METFSDSKGKHRLYTVRSFGAGRGFGVLNRYTNNFLDAKFSTRKAAWDYLAKQERRAEKNQHAG